MLGTGHLKIKSPITNRALLQQDSSSEAFDARLNHKTGGGGEEGLPCIGVLSQTMWGGLHQSLQACICRPGRAFVALVCLFVGEGNI